MRWPSHAASALKTYVGRFLNFLFVGQLILTGGHLPLVDRPRRDGIVRLQ